MSLSAAGVVCFKHCRKTYKLITVFHIWQEAANKIREKLASVWEGLPNVIEYNFT